MKVTLQDEVWEEGNFTFHDGEKARVRYRFFEKLIATQCDCCGKVFGLPKGARQGASKIILKMDKESQNHGKSIWLDICSVGCGLKLSEGAWKQATVDPMNEDGAHPFVAIEAKVKDYELNALTDIISRTQLLEQWAQSGQKPDLLPRSPTIHRDGKWILVRGGNSGSGYTVEIEREQQ